MAWGHRVLVYNRPLKQLINTVAPSLRSSHKLSQRPSRQKQFPSINDADAVDGDEVGGERDPRVDFGGHDVAPVAADAEIGNPSPHEFHRDGVGQFVAVDVDDERLGQSEISNEPADQPEGKEPELRGGPEVGTSGSL